MSTKTCTKCHEAKPLAEFGRHRLTKDGLHSQCKVCWNARNRTFRAIPTNREKRNAALRAIHAIPENYAKERDAKICDRYTNSRYDSDRAARRAIYASARALGPDFHVDHIIPLAGNNEVRGLHVSWNLQILSRADNRAKGDSFAQPDALSLTPVNAAQFVKDGLSVCC